MKFQGGESAVQRLMQAYGFTMKKQLGDHLGAGTGTISTWVKRDYFPGEAIVRCALETGADLEWLATGEGEKYKKNDNKIHSCIKVPCQELNNGLLSEVENCFIDIKLLRHVPKKPMYIVSEFDGWLVELDFGIATDGLWLLKKGSFGATSVNEVSVVPGGNFKIEDVIWPINEVTLIGLVIRKDCQL
ncbi:hypothetical protein XK97_06085 [Obesumbacterium proteus]|uniref:phage repressor protein CI n=1 Tax=Obesumbacterium proteus TaxID=82983 RepID=UPI000622A55B|nr:phage repressor protein CI [Obesumbacterium proteus]KKI47945.1 hypothetical protein XK97_06085 [Obesumbacterium proteus]